MTTSQDLSWNVVNVTDMSSMFEEAKGFNISLNKWDPQQVTNMSSMFKNATHFNNGYTPSSALTLAEANNLYLGRTAGNATSDATTTFNLGATFLGPVYGTNATLSDSVSGTTGTFTYLRGTDATLSGSVSGTTGTFTYLRGTDATLSGSVSGTTGTFTYLRGTDATFSGSVSGTTGTFTYLSGTDATFSGSVSGTTGSFTYLSGTDATFSGSLYGAGATLSSSLYVGTRGQSTSSLNVLYGVNLYNTNTLYTSNQFSYIRMNEKSMQYLSGNDIVSSTHNFWASNSDNVQKECFKISADKITSQYPLILNEAGGTPSSSISQSGNDTIIANKTTGGVGNRGSFIFKTTDYTGNSINAFTIGGNQNAGTSNQYLYPTIYLHSSSNRTLEQYIELLTNTFQYVFGRNSGVNTDINFWVNSAIIGLKSVMNLSWNSVTIRSQDSTIMTINNTQVTVTQPISGTNATFTGAVSGTTGSFTYLSGTDATFAGSLYGAGATLSGSLYVGTRGQSTSSLNVLYGVNLYNINTLYTNNQFSYIRMNEKSMQYLSGNAIISSTHNFWATNSDNVQKECFKISANEITSQYPLILNELGETPSSSISQSGNDTIIANKTTGGKIKIQSTETTSTTTMVEVSNNGITLSGSLYGTNATLSTSNVTNLNVGNVFIGNDPSTRTYNLNPNKILTFYNNNINDATKYSTIYQENNELVIYNNKSNSNANSGIVFKVTDYLNNPNNILTLRADYSIISTGVTGPGSVEISRVLCGTDATFSGTVSGRTGRFDYLRVESDQIALGSFAGNSSQSNYSVAIGREAGQTSQLSQAIAIGRQAGANTQGSYSVAIGNGAAKFNQGASSVAIGSSAGASFQGEYSVAIGANAGKTTQTANSIILNADSTPAELNSYTSGFFVNPIRTTSVATGANVLTYDTNLKEIGSSSTLIVGATGATFSGPLYGTSATFSGNVYVGGVKTFVIDHPTNPKKYLVHACLEGPESAVYYRGKGTIANNVSTIIQLPDYVESLATDFTIQITPIYNGNSLTTYNVSDLVNNEFHVYGLNGSFFWLVHGLRSTIHVEPDKSSVSVRGDGPYTWIPEKTKGPNGPKGRK